MASVFPRGNNRSKKKSVKIGAYKNPVGLSLRTILKYGVSFGGGG
jgi:hypothetical protein